MKKFIALARGDGAGPEMMDVACPLVIEAAEMDGIYVEFVDTPMGWNAYQKYSDTCPDESYEKAAELGILYSGGVGDPKYDDTIGEIEPEMKPEPRSLLRIRKGMGLLQNFRPLIWYPELKHLSALKPELIPDKIIRQIWLRFLLEDSYYGNADLFHDVPEETRKIIGMMMKKDVTGNEEIVSDIAYYRKATIEKYVRAAFKYAVTAELPVISVDKANVMARYEFWRKIVTRIAKEEFPQVKFIGHQYVDSANALLCKPELLHGVIICGNEHGDIVSDGAAQIFGSMGLMCSSAVNPDTGDAMFESGAGTAPTLKGLDKANPIGRILTGAMMLRHIGAVKGANAIEQAVSTTLEEGFRTADLVAGKFEANKLLGTVEMGKKIRSFM